MKMRFYTNENEKRSVIYYQRNDGDETAISEPHSLVEYEIYRNLHLAINSDGGEEQLKILVEQLEDEAD